ncbi:ATPase [Tilletia horrida]|nr:ATPase [Tilletia horrida]
MDDPLEPEHDGICPSFAVLPKPDVKPAGMNALPTTLTFQLFKALEGKGLYRNMKAPRGALLYGSPGTGKTLAVSYAAAKTGITCLKLKASQVHSKYNGTSENLLARMSARAKELGPAIIIFDEIDCIFPGRGSEAGDKHPSILAQLLTELDAAQDARVAVIATTNIVIAALAGTSLACVAQRLSTVKLPAGKRRRRRPRRRRLYVKPRKAEA